MLGQSKGQAIMVRMVAVDHRYVRLGQCTATSPLGVLTVFALGTMALILSVVFVRHRQSQKAVEERQVAALVTVALDSLRNQELAHHTDPVMVPRPYLSSLQLRDLVLQDVHSVGTRKRLWSHVERIVEANTNVRTNLQEVEGGDEQRVWQWIGSTGKTLPPGTPGVRQLDFGGGGRIVA